MTTATNKIDAVAEKCHRNATSEKCAEFTSSQTAVTLHRQIENGGI